jgi:hypothetical protein
MSHITSCCDVDAASAAATTAAVHRNRINSYVCEIDKSVKAAAKEEKSSVSLPAFMNEYASGALSSRDRQEVKEALEAKGFTISYGSVRW